MVTRRKADSDDVLYVIRSDRNEIVDRKVYSEFGLLCSDDNKWSFTHESVPIPVVRWVSFNGTPVSDGRAYIVLDESNDFEDEDKIINQSMRSVYEGFSNGTAKEQRNFDKWIKYIKIAACLAITAGFLVAFVAMPFMQPTRFLQPEHIQILQQHANEQFKQDAQEVILSPTTEVDENASQ